MVAKYIWIYGQLTIGQLALDLSFGYRSKINKYIYIYIYKKKNTNMFNYRSRNEKVK